jgi:peptide chain release factor 2
MLENEAEQLALYAGRLEELREALNIDAAKAKIADLEAKMAAPGFWDEPDEAQRVVQRLKGLKRIVDAPESLQKDITDARELLELCQLEEDASMGAEVTTMVAGIEEALGELEIGSLLSDERDAKNAIVSIHPGAGGTESCDWAAMLYRMITRFCERKEFAIEIIDLQPGDEAGIKSATIKVEGPFAYGYLKSEAGVHRLVRISPFDANARRHTSFAAIEVITPVDKDIDIEVPEDELKVDVFRSSGPGGQKVNKTSSAVRITHQPTGIVVACQVERSQHQNRARAMDMLKAKLYDIEMRKKEAELEAQREGQQDVAWGSQIRSYVMQPYQMVKDHRTNTETGNVDAVLDGALQNFVEAYLKWKLERRGGRSSHAAT